MIIKIRDRSNGRDFWLYDKIARIVLYDIFYHPVGSDFSDEEADLVISNHSNNGDYKVDSNSRFGKITARFDNNNEMCIIFDTVMYVMNDEGQTIDTIYING